MWIKYKQKDLNKKEVFKEKSGKNSFIIFN